MSSHSCALGPVIRRMTLSAQADVVTAGAAWATLAWLRFAIMGDVFEECAEGSASQRKGVAEVLAQQLPDLCWRADAMTELVKLFDDSDREVRHAAAQVFAAEGVLGPKEATALARAFVASVAFSDDPTRLVLALEAHKGPLHPIAQVIFD